MSDFKSRMPVRQIHNRSATPTDDDLIHQPTGTIGTRADSTTIHSQDVSVQDSNGNKITPANPLPVTVMQSTPGDGVVDFSELVDIAKDASAAKTYVIPAGKLFNLKQILVSGSGKIRAEIKWGVVASEVVKSMIFNSAVENQAIFTVDVETEIPAASNIIVTVRNDDKAAFSAFVTIQGTLFTNP